MAGVQVATGGKTGVPLPIVLLVPAVNDFRIKVRSPRVHRPAKINDC